MFCVNCSMSICFVGSDLHIVRSGECANYKLWLITLSLFNPFQNHQKLVFSVGICWVTLQPYALMFCFVNCTKNCQLRSHIPMNNNHSAYSISPVICLTLQFRMSHMYSHDTFIIRNRALSVLTGVRIKSYTIKRFFHIMLWTGVSVPLCWRVNVNWHHTNCWIVKKNFMP